MPPWSPFLHTTKSCIFKSSLEERLHKFCSAEACYHPAGYEVLTAVWLRIKVTGCYTTPTGKQLLKFQTENTHLQLLDPEYDDTIILQNVGN